MRFGRAANEYVNYLLYPITHFVFCNPTNVLHALSILPRQEQRMKIKRAEDNSMNILRRRGKIAFKNSARFIENRFWNGSFRIKKNELVARDVYISRVYPGIKSVRVVR